MAATTDCNPAPAKPVSPLLYPILLIAGIAVIVASLLGMAEVTGLLYRMETVSNGGAPVPVQQVAAPALQSGAGHKAVTRNGVCAPSAADPRCGKDAQ